MNKEKRPAEAMETQNPGKKFQSALDYIIGSFVSIPTNLIMRFASISHRFETGGKQDGQ
ncbi:hypothetical protein BAC3_01160 [uncultured bacterium]|nr:hypothetical protein BAC3_01160 [uncultured bacterium]